MPAPSDLELLMEVATRSEPRVNDDVCNQLLALAEAASQHSKVAPQWPLNPPTMYAHQSQEETPSGRECHTLPMLHIGVHYSSKDEPGSTGRYGDNTLCNPAYHSSSASPSMACAPHVLVEKAPGKQRRATRGTATGPTRDPSPSNDGQPPRKYRKYATNVPRMGRIPWIDNRHTDKKLRSKYAGVTQVCGHHISRAAPHTSAICLAVPANRAVEGAHFLRPAKADSSGGLCGRR